MPHSVLELIELGLDFHRQLFLFSREDRVLIAAALVNATLQEYPADARFDAFDAQCERASAAVLSVRPK